MRLLVLVSVLIAVSPAYAGHMEWEGHEPGPVNRKDHLGTHQARAYDSHQDADVDRPGPEVYISGYGGVALGGSATDLEGTGGLAGVRFSDLDHKGGSMFGGKIGMSPTTVPWLALEVEGIYTRIRFKSQTATATGPGGSVTFMSGDTSGDGYGVLANAILRYPTGIVRPYIGGGVGYMISERGAAFQFLAGIRVRPVEQFSFFGEFKYLISHIESNEAGFGLEGTVNIPALVGGASVHF